MALQRIRSMKEPPGLVKPLLYTKRMEAIIQDPLNARSESLFNCQNSVYQYLYLNSIYAMIEEFIQITQHLYAKKLNFSQAALTFKRQRTQEDAGERLHSTRLNLSECSLRVIRSAKLTS